MCQWIYNFIEVIGSNCSFMGKYLCRKMRDNLLTGTEHSVKISP